MRKMEQRIHLSPPHMSGNEQSYIQHAFVTNWIACLGPNVNTFEKELSSLGGQCCISPMVRKEEPILR